MGKDDHYNGGREGHKVGFRVRGSMEGAGSARASEIAEKAWLGGSWKVILGRVSKKLGGPHSPNRTKNDKRNKGMVQVRHKRLGRRF